MTRFTTAGKKLKKYAVSLGVFALWIGLWQIAAAALSQEILLVSPGKAALRLFQLIREPDFWLTVGTSCTRIMAGFLLALAAGAFLDLNGGTLTVRNVSGTGWVRNGTLIVLGEDNRRNPATILIFR